MFSEVPLKQGKPVSSQADKNRIRIFKPMNIKGDNNKPSVKHQKWIIKDHQHWSYELVYWARNYKYITSKSFFGILYAYAEQIQEARVCLRQILRILEFSRTVFCFGVGKDHNFFLKKPQ